MTQEDKRLLLKDLCARLPYGVVLNVGDNDLKLDKQHQNIGILYPEDCSDEFNKAHNSTFYIVISGCYYGENIKPYLRPMSSITEEEAIKYVTLTHYNTDDNGKPYRELTVEALDWLNKNHIDYRGLILKGLALEAPEDMYKSE